MDDMEEVYLRFVVERHRMWELRQQGAPQPWTDDPVLRTRKFTNVYRILDHGSQFLVQMMDGAAPEDQLVRAFGYRYTNRPEPWQAFYEDMGRYPVRADLDSLLPQFWRDYHAQGNPLFGTAYKMFVGQENRGWTRSEWVMRHINDAMGYGPDNVVDAFLSVEGPAAKHGVLLTVPRCANFMAMQVLTDWNYLNDLPGENRFVVAGPGSTLGAKEIDPTHKPLHMIQWARAAVLDLPDAPRVEGRYPSYMDIQNTLCEFSKYVRYLRLGVPPGKPDYRPAHPGQQPTPWLPVNWK